MKYFVRTTVLIALMTTAACVTPTSNSSAQPGAAVAIEKTTQSMTPRSERMNDTTFGNYAFCAMLPEHDPFAGVLPLRFHGYYLALDILFFAPATFYNLREAYAFYESRATRAAVPEQHKARLEDLRAVSEEAAEGEHLCAANLGS